MRKAIFLIPLLIVGIVGCTMGLTKDMRLSEQGFDYLQAGKYVKAEKYLKEALAENKDNPYALLNLGVVYQKTGRPDQARQMYQRVIDLNPTSVADRSNIKADKGKSLVELARENLKTL